MNAGVLISKPARNKDFNINELNRNSALKDFSRQRHKKSLEFKH